MSVAEEINKLSELHKQGTITEEEFDSQKRRLLRQSASGGKKRWPLWLRLLIAIPVMAVGAYGLYDALGRLKNNIPACDSDYAIKTVKDIVADAQVGKEKVILVTSLERIQELTWSEITQIRDCTAKAVLSTGEVVNVDYVMEWATSQKKSVKTKIQFR